MSAQRGTSRRPSGLGVLLLTVVLTQAALFATRPMTSYRIIELGGSGLHVGLVAACFSLLPLLVAVRVGREVDRDRGILLLRVGIGLSAVSTVGIALATSIAQIAALTAVFGTAHLLNAVAAQGVLSRAAEISRQDQVFGAFTVAASVGQMIGPPLSSTVASWYEPTGRGTAAAIGVAGALSLVALASTFRLRPVAAPSGSSEPAGEHRRVSSLMRTRGMVPVILASAALLACVDLVTAFLPVLAVERGVSVGAVGWLLALRAGASMAARLIVHRLLIVISRRPLLTGSMVLSAALLAAVPWFERVWVLALLLTVAGFVVGIGQPLSMTWVTLLANRGSRGTALALRLAGNRVGQICVPSAAAVVAGSAGAAGVFVLMSVVLTFSSLPVLRSPDPGAGHDFD